MNVPRTSRLRPRLALPAGLPGCVARWAGTSESGRLCAAGPELQIWNYARECHDPAVGDGRGAAWTSRALNAHTNLDRLRLLAG